MMKTGIESTIIDLVIESDEFVEAVTNTMQEDIRAEIESQVGDIDFEDQIKDALGEANSDLQAEVDNLKEEVEKLGDIEDLRIELRVALTAIDEQGQLITSLQSQIDSLRQYMRAIDKTNEQYLVRVNRIVDRLQSIPLFGWFFKKLG
jgi:chromosome segregation ATPase